MAYNNGNSNNFRNNNQRSNNMNRNNKPRTAAERHDFFKAQKKAREERAAEIIAEQKAWDNLEKIYAVMDAVKQGQKDSIPKATQPPRMYLYDTLRDMNAIIDAEKVGPVTEGQLYLHLRETNFPMVIEAEQRAVENHIPDPSTVTIEGTGKDLLMHIEASRVVCPQVKKEELAREKEYSVVKSWTPEEGRREKAEERGMTFIRREQRASRQAGEPVELLPYKKIDLDSLSEKEQVKARKEFMIWGVVPQMEVSECHQFVAETYPGGTIL